VPYRVGYVAYQAYALNSTNWWQSVDEPFHTNASYFNAGFCWYFSCVLMLYSPMFGGLFLVVFLAVPLAFLCGNKAVWGNAIVPFFQNILLITWDIKISDVFPSVIKTKVVRNDSK